MLSGQKSDDATTAALEGQTLAQTAHDNQHSAGDEVCSVCNLDSSGVTCEGHRVCDVRWSSDVDESLVYLVKPYRLGESNVESITLTSSDFFSLADHNEVESIVIDSFLFILFSRTDNGLPSGVWMMPTGVASSLTADVIADWKEERGTVRRVLFPASYSIDGKRSHWVLYVVDVDVENTTMKVTCYDSLDDSFSSDTAESRTLGNSIATTMAEGLGVCFDGTITFPRETPQQEHTDCGVFVIVFVICAVFDIPLQGVASLLSSPDNVELWRKAIAGTILKFGEQSDWLRGSVADIAKRRRRCKVRNLRRRR